MKIFTLGHTHLKVQSPTESICCDETALNITTGDFDLDGIDDLVGVFYGKVFYGVKIKQSTTGNWITMTENVANSITCGDLTDDKTDNLVVAMEDYVYCKIR